MTTPTTSPFDPELRRIANILPRSAVGPKTLPVMRRLDAIQRRRTKPGIDVENLGHISCRVHRPPTTAPGPHPALLWIWSSAAATCISRCVSTPPVIRSVMLVMAIPSSRLEMASQQPGGRTRQRRASQTGS
jgi:hypothetical protein